MMRTAYFHEDDYCQIELLPSENLEWCNEEIRKIRAFSDAHDAGIGWTDMYVRSRAPVPLRTRNIAAGDFAAAIAPLLPRFDRVTTGYSTAVEDLPFTSAFGVDHSFVIYAEAPDSYLSAVWLDVAPNDKSVVRVAEDALRACDRWHLLLVDWSFGTAIPLDEAGKYSAYLLRFVPVK